MNLTILFNSFNNLDALVSKKEEKTMLLYACFCYLKQSFPSFSTEENH